MIIVPEERACTCGDRTYHGTPDAVERHRTDGQPCYTQPHDERFLAVWNAIKGWDIQRTPGAGYAGATGDDVCTILEALA